MLLLESLLSFEKDKERHCIKCFTSAFFFPYSKLLDVENLAFTCELLVCVCIWRRVKTRGNKLIFIFLASFPITSLFTENPVLISV